MKNTVFYVRMTKIIENVKNSTVWENAPRSWKARYF